MSIITLWTEEDFKARVAAAAVRAGKPLQEFLLEAIAERTDEVERNQAFYREPDRRNVPAWRVGEAVFW